MKEIKDRNFCLDFVRVIAMIMIILFHFLAGIESYELLKNPDVFKVGGISLLNLGGVNLTLGNYGVSLFFILSGVGLMYVYQDEMVVNEFYRKRIRAIYPLYYTAFITASFVQLLVKYKLNYGAPLWTLLLTVLGMDGWMADIVSTYALVGDWFVGCIICIYILFPVLRKCMNRHPNITIVIYTLIFLLWEHIYPFDFPKRSSIVLRMFEVLLGMYYIRTNRKVTWKGALVSLVLLGIVFAVKLPVSLYILVPVAGMSSFLVLSFIAQWLKNVKIQKVIFYMSNYSFSVFLIHHFILYMILGALPERSLGILGMCGMLIVCLAVIGVSGIALKKIEEFVMETSYEKSSLN